MLSFLNTEGGLTVQFKGKTVLAHTEKEPFALALTQKIEYKSTRGSFRVKEKILKAVALSSVRSEKENEIIFSDGGINLVLYFTLHKGILKISLKSNHNGGFSFRLPSQRDEGIFGGGEQFRQLNLKGERVENFVSEHITLKPIIQKTVLSFLPYRTKRHSEIHSYSPMSTFVSSRLYAIRFHTDGYGVSDFSDEGVSVFRFSKLPSLVSYVAEGSFSEIGRQLALDLANNQYLPSWCHDGMILGVQGGIDRAEGKVLAMAERGARICGVWCQDWSGKKVTAAGKQVYWNWEADSEMYPDLKSRVAKLAASGVQFLGYINPYLVVDSNLYCLCKERGYLIKNREGSIYHIKSTTFNAGMMDLTNPGMVDFLKNVIIKKNMLDLGIRGYMADFGEYLPVDAVLFDGDAEELHNEWPTVWARINREAISEAGLEKEAMFFTRSGYNEAQCHTPIMWNGDQHTDFSLDYGLPCVMPASFNLGFSGLTLTHSDIGGFISFSKLRRDAELFVRWMEMNTFSPLMRSHETIRPDINVQYDSDGVMEHTVRLTNIHARMKPYIERCVENARGGIPAIAPDFYYSSDFTLHRDEYSYFFGPDIFVSPVIKRGEALRKVHLPEGTWVHFFTKKEYSGGSSIEIAAPLGTPAAFFRKDSEFAELFENCI